MTRSDFEAAITARYRDLVRIAQKQINNQRVTGVQGEEIIAQIVAHLLSGDPPRYEALTLGPAFPIGYFWDLIHDRVVDHYRMDLRRCHRDDTYRESTLPHPEGERAEIRAIFQREMDAIEDPLRREVARLVFVEGWRQDQARDRVGLGNGSGALDRWLSALTKRLREALKEYRP